MNLCEEPMALEDILKFSGVQHMLVQVMRQAAPDLERAINDFTDVLKEFNERSKRVEEMQAEILTLLRGQHDGQQFAGSAIRTIEFNDANTG